MSPKPLTLEAKLTVLAEEHVRTKRSNQMLTLAVAVLSVISTGLSVAAFAFSGRPAPPAESPRSDVIEAKRFIVRNPDGSLAAEFGFMSDGWNKGRAGIRFFENGRPLVELGLGNNHSAGLTLRDRLDQERVFLTVQSSVDPGLEADEAEFAIYSPSGNPFANLSSHKNSGYFSLQDGKGHGRIQLAVPAKDDPPLSLPDLIFFDAKGDTIFELRPTASK